MGDQNQETLGQLVRYNLVGLVNTVAAYLLYAGLVFLGVSYTLALVADYAFGTLVGFFLNKHFTFRRLGKVEFQMVIRQVTTAGVTFGVNLATLWALVEKVGINEYLGQGLALFLVMVCGFLGQKFWVFHR
jgi:putative flippase GtrA